MSFQVPFLLLQGSTSSLTDSSVIGYLLLRFAIEGFRAWGPLARILCAHQSLAPVVWLRSKGRRMLWRSFENLRNVPLKKKTKEKTEIAKLQPASIPGLNYHPTR